MGILLLAPDRDLRGLVEQLEAQAPDIDLHLGSGDAYAGEPDFAVCWNPPAGVLQHIPSLKAVSSLGAGVERLLDPDVVPTHLPIGRISGPALARDMARWLVAQITHHWLQLDRYRRQQELEQWHPMAPSRDPAIGLLGMGSLGRECARQFQHLGLQVLGWSRSGRGPRGVEMHRSAQGLLDLAADVDYLICLLPLTEETRDILDRELFAAMRADSVVINVGRGQHLVEDDLIAALDDQTLALAILDVFRQEPLPSSHPFWNHPRVRVSPHCAALSRDDEVASLVIQSYRRVKQGQPPLGCVDRKRGY